MKATYECIDCGYIFQGDNRRTDGARCPKCEGRIVPQQLFKLNGAIEKLELKQGDRLVVKIDALLSDAAYENIASNIAKWAGEIPVLVLDKRASIAVATPGGPSISRA